MKKLDGRKARWIDCDWNSDNGDNGCGVCRICRYLEFVEWATNVAPSGSTIGFDWVLEKYLKETDIAKKQQFILNKINDE